jgi:hypothetical protein
MTYSRRRFIRSNVVVVARNSKPVEKITCVSLSAFVGAGMGDKPSRDTKTIKEEGFEEFRVTRFPPNCIRISGKTTLRVTMARASIAFQDKEIEGK